MEYPVVAVLLPFLIPVTLPAWRYWREARRSGRAFRVRTRMRVLRYYMGFTLASGGLLAGAYFASCPNRVLRAAAFVPLIGCTVAVANRILTGLELPRRLSAEGRRVRSEQFNLCPHCECPLTGNTSQACPECGSLIPRQPADMPRDWST